MLLNVTHYQGPLGQFSMAYPNDSVFDRDDFNIKIMKPHGGKAGSLRQFLVSVKYTVSLRPSVLGEIYRKAGESMVLALFPQSSLVKIERLGLLLQQGQFEQACSDHMTWSGEARATVPIRRDPHSTYFIARLDASICSVMDRAPKQIDALLESAIADISARAEDVRRAYLTRLHSTINSDKCLSALRASGDPQLADMEQQVERLARELNEARTRLRALRNQVVIREITNKSSFLGTTIAPLAKKDILQAASNSAYFPSTFLLE